jgi:broad specificity phosphatase PhoE
MLIWRRRSMLEPALMERDCGLWSGLTIDEIATRYPDEWHGRLDDPYHHRPPEGENLPDMEQRVGGAARHGARRSGEAGWAW